MLLLRDGLENQEVDLCGQSRPVWGLWFFQASKHDCTPSRRRVVPVRHRVDIGLTGSKNVTIIWKEEERVASG